MELDARWVEIETAGQICTVYRARPAAAHERLPGILVIQEVWGVDEHIQDLAHRFANAGYLAVAPELYSVGGRPPEFAPERIAGVKAFLEAVPPAVWTNPEARDQAVAALPDGQREQVGGSMAKLFGPRDTEALLRTLGDSVSALRDDSDCDGRVASVGFCMGGHLSARLAARRADLAGAAVFYGAPPSEEEIVSIRCPVLGFYGGDDTRITEAVPGFAQAMERAGLQFDAYIYAGAPHAFFNDTRRSYRPAAARDAWARCLTFFATQLGQ